MTVAIIATIAIGLFALSIAFPSKKGEQPSSNFLYQMVPVMDPDGKKGFYMGKYQVTQAQWEAVMGSNPSKFKDYESSPVEQVSWDNVQVFVTKLNQMAGTKYRLPTEAEWRYAARGGSKSKGYKYAGSDNLNKVAWHKGNSKNEPRPVGMLNSNELGLYDMCGNVREWASNTEDGVATVCGGGYLDDAKQCEITYKNVDYCHRGLSYNGLRLVHPLV